MIGDKLEPIFLEIEACMIENSGTKQNYSNDAFRAVCYIFIELILDKSFDLMVKENIDINIREAMALKCGEDFRQLIKTYTNIDTHDFYKP